MKKIGALIICFVLILTPVAGWTQGCGNSTESSSWSNFVHQENSLAASVLLIPYLIALVPYRMIDGILRPKPTSHST
ncbi:MAG: hypothetical protein V1792_08060, partial [Pseudomonadota bacterium]